MGDGSATDLTVFLVEDSAVMREEITAALTAGGLRVVGWAATAEDAIEQIRRKRPSVALLDLTLERGTGLDVLLAIRHERLPTRAIVFANNVDAVLRKWMLRAGADAALDKSTEGERLAETIRAELNRVSGVVRAIAGQGAERDRPEVDAGTPLSDNQTRALADSIPHLVWIAGADGRMEYFNRRWTEYTGIGIDELKGGDRLDVIHPEDAGAMLSAWNISIADGVPYEIEYRLRRADGEYRWHIARAMPLKDDAGMVVQWFGTATEIHEQRRNEEAVARHARLLAQVRDSVIVTDLAGVVTYWNQGATEQFGWTADEMLGRPVSTRVPGPARAQLEQRLRDVTRDREVAGEYLDYRKDGSRVWIEARASQVFDNAGEAVGMMDVSRDITERRQAEQALRLRDRAIQAVTQGIVITDPGLPDNPIIFASPGFERLTGYGPAEVIGRNCRFLQGTETDPEAASRVREAIREARPITEALLNYRKDGTSFWNELSISPVRDEAGQITHFVGVQNDITARKSLEEQYLQAQKMEAIGQLASGVAHDFNNLLTIINGYSDLMLQDVDASGPLHEMLAQVRKAGDRSAGLTRQLLAFGRKQVTSPKVLDLNATVTNLEKMLRRIIGEDVLLTTVLAPDLGTAKLDPGQVEQVIMNLAVNARDAMPDGGQLTIETRNVELDETYAQTHAEARAGSFVMLAVSDTGSGMSAETRARIFEPFFTTKPSDRGTGLGLSVVHGIVRQNGGHVVPYSEVGVGTTFKIYWPRVDEALPAAKPWLARSPPPRGSETLLLVEDDDVVRALSRHVLAGCGYGVLEAMNGESALREAAAHSGTIHCVITDVVMPGMGGQQLAARLTQIYPGLKTLFVSGYTEDAIIRHGVLRAEVHFLQKPFSPLALAKKVREILDDA